jgi:hypothetical protein
MHVSSSSAVQLFASPPFGKPSLSVAMKSQAEPPPEVCVPDSDLSEEENESDMSYNREENGSATSEAASHTSMSSREYAVWLAALAPCVECNLRTPFRCGHCQEVVCYDPRCRARHEVICGITLRQRMQNCLFATAWWLCEAAARVR